MRNSYPDLNPSAHKIILLKTLIIFMVCTFYTIAFAQSPEPLHNSQAQNAAVLPDVINNVQSNPSKSKGVCVFDIDFTLVCPGAAAAVKVCKDAGFDLAVNTARNKRDALMVLNDGTLLKKGFSKEFVDNALKQQGLNGPFQYEEAWSAAQPAEQREQNKSYGMRKIANYYNLKTDDIESRKLVLFDDMLHNIVQMQPDWYEGYSKERCKYGTDGLCFVNSTEATYDTEFPRNWKIYRSKWIGHFCARWWDSKTAADDAKQMITDILNNKERVQYY